jgi:CheY-like chemotaxis protein
VRKGEEEKARQVQEDVNVIKSSLNFIYDLLRCMLDSHKVSDGQLKLEAAPTDLLSDVLEPVKTILSRRDDNFELIVECPQNLVISVDRMRLKQIVLNLASNSRKFVQRGFVRLEGNVLADGNVQIAIEDSGPGIPLQRREKIFMRFQESLDSLSQGTGIGLSLCKNLAELMGGEIFLDESYHSGVEGCPGARFVVNLNISPIDLDSADLDRYELALLPPNGENRPVEVIPGHVDSQIPCLLLPDTLSVLVVDDDLVLRKLISRPLKRVAPSWTIQEAANGETALHLVDSTVFDLIFMDQYMASAEKQLLGTETVRALRAKGVGSRICGLSGNDMSEQFLKAGADFFLRKPISCEKDAFRIVLAGILERDTSLPLFGSRTTHGGNGN